MTQQQTDRSDRLVEDYLDAVANACADLSPQRRDELVADLREHIASARAGLPESTEAAVRTILDRLGEPTAIAEEARLGNQKVIVGESLGLPGFAMGSVPQPGMSRSTAATLGVLLGFGVVVVMAIVAGTILILAR